MAHKVGKLGKHAEAPAERSGGHLLGYHKANVFEGTPPRKRSIMLIFTQDTMKKPH